MEVGEKSDVTINSAVPIWFWADARPDNNCTGTSCGSYFNHFGNQILYGDFNNSAILEIYGNGPNTYNGIASAATGDGISGASTGNSMVPDQMTVGLDVAGTTAGSGATASTANFTSNNYRNSSGYWYPQTTTQGFDHFFDAPLHGSYTPNASGGTVTTYCGC